MLKVCNLFDVLWGHLWVVVDSCLVHKNLPVVQCQTEIAILKPLVYCLWPLHFILLFTLCHQIKVESFTCLKV